ncbi:MAG: hypothetical protein LBC88_05110, partial [Spirochaetaceae bacterium]|nr:hypothetical protein [Spirochaetaceae bacterium]
MHTFLPRRAALFFAVLTAWFLPRAGAEEFTWKHRAGDRYRIISTVREDVSINREFSHHAEILNRISAEVERVEGDNAIHRAVFLTAEEAFPDAAAGSSPDMATPDMATP